MRFGRCCEARTNQRLAYGIGVSSPCGAVSTRDSSIFFPGLSRYMERPLDRRWDSILPRWSWLNIRTIANQRSAGGVGISTPCGEVSTRMISVFVPGLLELCSRVDRFRSRDVTLSCPGGAYFVYESRPMSDQIKITCTCFYCRL